MPTFKECRAYVVPGMPSACKKYGLCLRKREVLFQAANGGYANREKTEPAGPYWSREGFEHLTNGAMTIAPKENCQELEQLRQTINSLREEKEQKGELI